MGNAASRESVLWGQTVVPQLNYWDMVVWRNFDEFFDPIVFNIIQKQRIDISDWPNAIYITNNTYIF